MKKILLLVDGSSYLYRAFHAMPDLRSPTGEPTGAIYGILNMLQKLRSDYKTNYGACVFDSCDVTFRKKLFPRYKANRSPMPHDLSVQIDPIYQVIKMLGWPLLKIDGIEADDIIGTLTNLAKQAGFHTIISTCDKDFFQLISNDVTIVNTMNGKVLTPDSFQEKFGLPPNLMIEYLMLTGDSIDNIPGVNRVGKIIASKWLKEFGSIEKIIESAWMIKGAIGENLRQAISFFPMARQLLTIKCDFDLNEFIVNANELEFHPKKIDNLIKFYEKYGFSKWLNELTISNSTLNKIEENYFVVSNWENFFSLKKKLYNSDLVAFTVDIENPKNNCLEIELSGLSFSVEPGKAFCIPFKNYGNDSYLIPQLPKNEVLSFLRPWLEDSKPKKITFDTKKNIHALMNEGIYYSGTLEDIMLASYMLNPEASVTLENLANRFLLNSSEQKKDYPGHSLKNFNNKTDFYKLAESSDLIFKLYLRLKQPVAQQIRLSKIYSIDLKLTKILADIERKGIALDISLLTDQSRKLSLRMQELEQRIFKLTNTKFNLNSSKELGDVLFKKMEIPILRRTSTGKPATNEEVLKRLSLEYTLPKIVLEYRGFAKIKSTYTDKLPSMVNPITNRIHTNYSQIATKTGRLASFNPNLQNVPIRSKEGRQVREAFIPKRGFFLLSADYSQIELRVVAHLSGDQNLKLAFSEEKDIHRTTASDIFRIPEHKVDKEQRRFAKIVNFGLIYGMGISKLSSSLQISRTEAKEYIDRYFSLYPGLLVWIKKTKQFAREIGYIETVFGRRLNTPEVSANIGSYKQASAERSAINAPVQGSVADLIKMAMISIDGWLNKENMQTHMIIQVHDELVFEVPESELTKIRIGIPNLMCSVATLSIPLAVKISVGKNWRDMM